MNLKNKTFWVLVAALVGWLSTAGTIVNAQEADASTKKAQQTDKRMASSQWGGNYFPI